MKILLPEGVIRHDNKSYEEVIIPVSEPAPINVGNERVAISALDEVCFISPSSSNSIFLIALFVSNA